MNLKYTPEMLKFTAAALKADNIEVIIILLPQNVRLEHFPVLAASDAVFKIWFSGSRTSPQDAFLLALKSVNVWRSEYHFAHFSGPVPCLVQTHCSRAQKSLRKSCSLWFVLSGCARECRQSGAHLHRISRTPREDAMTADSAGGTCRRTEDRRGARGHRSCSLIREDTLLPRSVPAKLFFNPGCPSLLRPQSHTIPSSSGSPGSFAEALRSSLIFTGCSTRS